MCFLLFISLVRFTNFVVFFTLFLVETFSNLIFS